MAVQILPIVQFQKGERSQEFSVTLEGAVWQFEITWSYTAEAWKMSMSSAETGTTLRRLTLAPGHNLLDPHAVIELGQLWVVDTGAEFLNPTFEGLGDRFKVLYIPIEDIGNVAIV